MKTREKFAESFMNTIDAPDDKVKQLRIEAFEEFSKAGIPTRKQEYWKFSDPSVILNLDLEFNDSLNEIDEDYDLILCNGKIAKNKINCKTGSISEGIIQGDINENVLGMVNSLIRLNVIGESAIKSHIE